MKVYLSEYIYPPAREKLAQAAEIVDNFDHIEELDAIILRNIPVTAEMMDRAKNLKVIAKHGIGVNTIDVKVIFGHGHRCVHGCFTGCHRHGRCITDDDGTLH